MRSYLFATCEMPTHTLLQYDTNLSVVCNRIYMRSFDQLGYFPNTFLFGLILLELQEEDK